MTADGRTGQDHAVRASGGDPPDVDDRWFARWLAVLGGLLLCWWGFSALAVPELLRWVHEGRTVPILSDVMAGRDTTPLERYLDSWRGLAWNVGIALAMFGITTLPLAFTLRAVEGRLRTPEHGFSLSAGGLGFLLAGVVLGMAGVVVLLAHLHPVAYVYSITEDYWVEYATFVAYFIAVLLFARVARGESGTRVVGPLALGLGALFIAGEEISWGQRILGIETPQLFETYNYQRELTLHNVWFPRNWFIGAMVGLLVLSMPWLTSRSARIAGLVDRFAVPVPRPHLRPAFLATAALLMTAGLGTYLKIAEVAELALGICTLLLALDVAARSATRRWPDARFALLSGGGSLAVVALLAIGLTHLAPNPGGLTSRLHALAAQDYPQAGLYRQAEKLFEYMERNPQWRTRGTRLAYGRVLLQMRQEERAREVLFASLRDQRDIPEDWPGAEPEARRREGEIHRLLGNRAEAEAAFRDAVSIDRARLKETTSRSEQASVHWSLAKTLYAWGETSDAVTQASLACEMTHERQLRRNILRWKGSKDVTDGDSPCDPSLMAAGLSAAGGS